MGRAVVAHYAAAALFAATLVNANAVARVSAQQGGQGRGGFVAHPQRPPGDPAAIERGKMLWGVNCTVCHGPDARGAMAVVRIFCARRRCSTIRTAG